MFEELKLPQAAAAILLGFPSTQEELTLAFLHIKQEQCFQFPDQLPKVTLVRITHRSQMVRYHKGTPS